MPWHRDRASTDDYPAEPPVFIADFYLDDADLDTCHLGGAGQPQVVRRAHRGGDRRAQPGRLLHPRRRADAAARRRRAVSQRPPAARLASQRLRQAAPRGLLHLPHRGHVEWEHGPHNHEYITAKQKVLRACLRERRAMPYAAAEAGFDYRPPAAHDKRPLADGETPATFRYPAAEYRTA